MSISRREFAAGLGSFAIASAFPRPSFAEDAYTIGGTKIVFRTYTFGGGGKTYIALHYSEGACVSAAREALQGRGGRVIQLAHPGGRNISFTLGKTRYGFDPNRAFTDRGAEASLKAIGKNFSEDAHKAVREFASEVLRHLAGRRGPIVALHNNSAGGALSIKSYAPGGALAASVKKLHEVKGESPDDFFFTTSSAVFEITSRAGFNVALQGGAVPDDGSLSVYCGQHGIPYVNVEAQPGHVAKQRDMIAVIA